MSGKNRQPQGHKNTHPPAQGRAGAYFAQLHDLLQNARASDDAGAAMALETAMAEIGRAIECHCRAGGRLFLIGNGGSAAIASHMAIDFTNAGGYSALCLNDGAALTCMGNDYGYEAVFARQIAAHGREGDMLIAISSSGASENILRAAAMAKEQKMTVITLSGFDAGNPLRRLGWRNLYLECSRYGQVEVGHLALLHAILDLLIEERT